MQCAGFLRIADSQNPLDATAVHPESYSAAEALISLCGYTAADIKEGRAPDLGEKVTAFGREAVAKKIGVGVPTLNDIIVELLRPGRDLRDDLPHPILRTDVLDINDLTVGMELKGTVRNVVDFGAFVDIGVHQDGLVHISQMSKQFLKHPADLVSVGDIVTVYVLGVEKAKKRISLSMLAPVPPAALA